jgi:hypothetical protein
MAALPLAGTTEVGLRLFDDKVSPPEAAKAVATHFNHHQINGGWGTAIGREWAEKRFPTCGELCDPADCKFSNGFCLVWTDRFVPEASCRDFAKRRGGG